ncbi:MAG TPA: hypothetical protein VJV22_00305, partial [Acidobacteriaceae bacterium]|nr:hypothetical protein [Acidobacteriaceae bacterium]
MKRPPLYCTKIIPAESWVITAISHRAERDPPPVAGQVIVWTTLHDATSTTLTWFPDTTHTCCPSGVIAAPKPPAPAICA